MSDGPDGGGRSDEAAWHTAMAPRPYQRKALAAAMLRNILLALDANAGKTLVAAELIARTVRGPADRTACRRHAARAHARAAPCTAER